MAEAKVPDNKPAKTRKGVSTQRLLREIREFVSTHSLTAETTVAQLEEALKDQIMKDLDLA